MRKRLYLFACVFLFSFSFASAEEVVFFDVDIKVSEDSTFLVSESITYDFAGTEKRGISRVLSKVHPQPSSSMFAERYLEIDLISVQKDGESENYTAEEDGNSLMLSVGEDGEIKEGEHTYEIVYKVSGGLLYFLNGDAEISWGINGGNWDTLIRRIHVELFDVDGIFSEGRACYRDDVGTQSSCDPILTKEDNIFFSATHLFPGETMTLSHAINQTKVEEVVLERAKTTFFLVPASVIVLLLLIIFVYQRSMRKKHEDESLQEEVSSVE